MRIYVGSYSIPSEWTGTPYGHGEGISVHSAKEGAVDRLFPPTFEVNPSFTVADPANSRLWAITEPEHGGELLCFDIARDGSLSSRPVARVVTGSDAPCHLALARDFAVVSHYHGATVSVIVRGGDGLPLDSAVTITLPDTVDGRDLSALRSRPHSAVVLPSGTEFAVADCGRDTISLYRWDARTHAVVLLAVVALQKGTGPRHLAWSQRDACLYASLQNSGGVAAIKVQNQGSTRFFEMLQMTEPGGLGRDRPVPSEIAIDPSEKFVVMTNRADNSLSVFEISNGGELVEVSCVDTQGINPRHFAFTPTGDRLLVAHQESDELTMFDFANGRLTYHSATSCATPTSVAFWS